MCLKEVAREKMKISFSSHGIKKISRKPRSNQERKNYFFLPFFRCGKRVVWKMLLPFIFMAEHNMYTYTNYILHSDKTSKWDEKRTSFKSIYFSCIKVDFSFSFSLRKCIEHDGFWDVVAIMSSSHFKIDISS